MKAEELMIGDWVLIGNNHIRVTSLQEGKDYVEVQPIPLTAKILEKNGFKGHNFYQDIYKDNYCKVCVSIAPRIEIDGMDLGESPINVSIEGALFDINMNISAIHELQHALKLCRIDKDIVL